MANKKEPLAQPDFNDEQKTTEWLNDENISEEDRQLRASQVQANENRRPEGTRTGLLNVVSDIQSRQGPPSANQ